MKHFALIAVAALATGCVAPPAPVQSNIIEIPMDISRGRPVVDVMINGEGPFSFVLDTGAPRGGMISAETVNTLGLTSSGTTMLGSPLGGDPVEANIISIDVLSLGEAESRNFDLASLTMGSMGIGDGVIGPALFDQGLVTFDFVSSTLRLGGEPPQDVTWVAFGESAPLLDATINLAGLDMPAHIDTGAPHVMSFPAKYETLLPLDGPVQVLGRGRTVDMEFEIRGAPLKSTATLGDASIPIENVTFGPMPVVNVGTSAMVGLVLTIDFPNQRFAVTGTATPTTPQVRRVRMAAPPADTSEENPGQD